MQSEVIQGGLNLELRNAGKNTGLTFSAASGSFVSSRVPDSPNQILRGATRLAHAFGNRPRTHRSTSDGGRDENCASFTALRERPTQILRRDRAGDFLSD